jgi:hypothetical protein
MPKNKKGDPTLDTSSLAPGWERRWGYPVSSDSVKYNWNPTERKRDDTRGGYVTKFNNQHASYFTPQSQAAINNDPNVIEPYAPVQRGNLQDYDNRATAISGVRGLFNANTKFNQVEEVKAGYVNPSRINIPSPSYEVPYQATVFQKDAPDFGKVKWDLTIPKVADKLALPSAKKKASEPFEGSTSATDPNVSKRGLIWSKDSKSKRPTKY